MNFTIERGPHVQDVGCLMVKFQGSLDCDALSGDSFTSTAVPTNSQLIHTTHPAAGSSLQATSSKTVPCATDDCSIHAGVLCKAICSELILKLFCLYLDSHPTTSPNVSGHDHLASTQNAEEPKIAAIIGGALVAVGITILLIAYCKKKNMHSRDLKGKTSN